MPGAGLPPNDHVRPVMSRGAVSAAVDAVLSDKRRPAADRLRAVAEVKARALADTADEFEVSTGGRTVRVSGVRYNAEANAVECTIEGASDEANPFRFHNPPTMVPDGTFTEGTDEFGNRVRVENFIEDPEAALRAIVARAIAAI